MTLTSTHEAATDLGFLLRKNPACPQSFSLLFGKAHVFFPKPRRSDARLHCLPAGKFRHRDHRFDWTRAEFQPWANGVAPRFGYNVRFLPVGPEDSTVGSPTQMGVFEKGKLL